jgi:mRNA interferase RelE/StbE
VKYQIKFTKVAVKFLLKQPHKQQERLLKSINQLPDIGDIKLMRGAINRYRLRVGRYRVIYVVEEDMLIVQVLTIGNRGDVYK